MAISVTANAPLFQAGAIVFCAAAVKATVGRVEVAAVELDVEFEATICPTVPLFGRPRPRLVLS